MSPCSCKLKFVKFIRSTVRFPLTYQPEIDTDASMGESDSQLTDFFYFKNLFAKHPTRKVFRNLSPFCCK